MFTDKRSKKVMLVAHCILNQNAKIDRCAHYPGLVGEVVEALLKAGVGVIQMPCPELLLLGLDRQANREAQTTIESEDTRVAERMAEPAGETLCRRLTADLVYQVGQYVRNGFEVVGVLGVNGSPTCAVEMGWANDQTEPGPGVFIRALQAALAQKGITLPMRGVRVYQVEAMRGALAELISMGTHEEK